MEVESRSRQRDYAPDEGHWGELRLVTGEVYAVTGNVARGTRSVRAPVRRRIDLPREEASKLVPRVPHGAERPGSGTRRAAGAPVVHQVSGGGHKRVPRCGYDAAGNDAGRYSRGGESGRRTLHASCW